MNPPPEFIAVSEELCQARFGSLKESVAEVKKSVDSINTKLWAGLGAIVLELLALVGGIIAFFMKG